MISVSDLLPLTKFTWNFTYLKPSTNLKRKTYATPGPLLQLKTDKSNFCALGVSNDITIPCRLLCQTDDNPFKGRAKLIHVWSWCFVRGFWQPSMGLRNFLLIAITWRMHPMFIRQKMRLIRRGKSLIAYIRLHQFNKLLSFYRHQFLRSVKALHLFLRTRSNEKWGPMQTAKNAEGCGRNHFGALESKKTKCVRFHRQRCQVIWVLDMMINYVGNLHVATWFVVFLR